MSDEKKISPPRYSAVAKFGLLSSTAVGRPWMPTAPRRISDAEFTAKYPRFPETVASANAYLKERHLDHLPKDHPDRMAAISSWAKAEMRKSVRDNPNLAAKDPNRLGAPKGWTRAGGA